MISSALRWLFIAACAACAFSPMSSLAAAPIYAVANNGDMFVCRYVGAADGLATWPIQAKKIGIGWDLAQVAVAD